MKEGQCYCPICSIFIWVQYEDVEQNGYCPKCGHQLVIMEDKNNEC